MSKILFNKIKNIGSSKISVNTTDVNPNSYMYICKNPHFFASYMSDITTLYTKGLVHIYDNNNKIIADADIWDSIDYNIQLANIYSPYISATPPIIDTSVTLNGYECDVICNPLSDITLTLPAINTLSLYKTINIKNISTYIVSITTSSTDTVDCLDANVVIHAYESVSLQPNSSLYTWIKLSSINTNTVIYNQTVATNIWGPISNPFGRPCSVEIIDTSGNEFEGDITHDSNFSHITITLSAPMSGKAILN